MSIRQEVFAATHLILQSGRWAKANWDDFQKASNDRYKLDEYLEKNGIEGVEWNMESKRFFDVLCHDYRQKSEEPGDFFVHYYGQTSEERRNFFTNLEDGIGFGASDDKDRVYGVLGMVNNNKINTESGDLDMFEDHHSRPSMQDFPVDYTKSVSEVYQDVIRFALSYDDNLDILCRYEARPDPSPDLPSWAVAGFQRLVGGPFQSLAKPSLYGENALPSVWRGDGKLKLYGCRIGSMQDLRPLGMKHLWEYSMWSLATPSVERQYKKAAVKLEPSILPNEVPETGPSEQTDPVWRFESLVVVPPFCRPGDLVVSLWPCDWPFALRPHAGGGFVFLGSVALVSREYEKYVTPVLELPETLRGEQFSLV